MYINYVNLSSLSPSGILCDRRSSSKIYLRRWFALQCTDTIDLLCVNHSFVVCANYTCKLWISVQSNNFNKYDCNIHNFYTKNQLWIIKSFFKLEFLNRLIQSKILSLCICSRNSIPSSFPFDLIFKILQAILKPLWAILSSVS